jgi:hypothetical protein
MPGPPKTIKNPYSSDGFLQVSTAEIQVSYGLAKAELFQHVQKNDLFELHYGFSAG